MTTRVPVLTEEMRQQALGRESKPITVEVERGAILRFAQAIGDTNPLWNDEPSARKSRYGGLIAPPTFLRSVPIQEIEIPFPVPQRRLDGGSEWEYFQPVRPGDRITAAGRIEDIYEKTTSLGPMLFIVTLISYTNQFGELVATQKSTHIRY